MVRTFFKSIGFDFKEHFESVRHNIYDNDASEIDANTLKIATAIYKGLNANDDPIQLPEVLSAGIGMYTKESIDQTFDKIIIGAKKDDARDLLQCFTHSATCSLSNSVPILLQMCRL